MSIQSILIYSYYIKIHYFVNLIKQNTKGFFIHVCMYVYVLFSITQKL